MIQSVFRPKHQKLILQCYPSPKLSIAETKPNQAELSYLIFYASSRRTKLEKVGNFLLKKTRSDISHKRVGHLKVTLYILHELIVKCSEDLGFITPYVITIITDIIDLKDLSTSQLANEVFITYCEYLQPIQRQVLSSDISLLKKFLGLIQKFLNCATFNSTEWLTISLSTALAFADRIDASYPHLGNVNLNKTAIHIIMDTLSHNAADLSLVKLTTATSAHTDEKFGSDIEDLAMRSLRSFFDTTSKRQVDESTKNVISYLAKKRDYRWASNILIISIKSTHIEMRHRVMIQVSIEMEKLVKQHAIETLVFLIKVASNVLSSHVIHFVGLPVLEILNKVIIFQKEMVEYNETSILKDAYFELVRNLANRVYYNNQINDMLKTIFSQYYFECTNSARSINEKQFILFSEILADNVRDILNVSEKPGINLKRSPFPISVFNYLYSVFMFENFPQSHQQIQTIWLILICDFYKEHATNMSEPNIEQCITNEAENGLCLYFETIDRILDSENLRPELVAQIAVTTSSMAKSFKINFVINFMKYASKWLENADKIQYSLSLLIVGLSASEIGEEAKPLAELADAKIAYSQVQGKWPVYINYQPTSFPSSGILTFRELESVILNIKVLAKWYGKIDRYHSHPSVIPQPPKRLNSLLIMSANTSITSFPIVDGNMTLNGIPNSANGAESSTSSIFNRTETSSTGDVDFSFRIPSSVNGNGGRSIRSGYSLRSGRAPRNVNISDLKKTRNVTISPSELANITNTKTAGSTLNSATAPLVTATPPTSSAKSSLGLAYSIAGLDLDD
ncbi:hypothetical protein CANINC_001805 [Pichia inconspicua]|uniref:Protein EFR3 n=1 Tax=Pichia inconspicua TaxID=52247 RepID=A0A4T0X3C3_9ASCO|nr:hypothetical protein CANINC_001805 [[Candida] inconspicua]